MNHYEVTVRSTFVVYVAEAKDEEQAIEYAKEHRSGDTYDVKLLATETERDSSRRHADAESKP